MSAVFERVYSVIAQSRWSTPNKNIAMRYRHTNRLFGSLQAAKQEDGRKPQRYRDDRLVEVVLILILMESEPRSRLVAVDKACVWGEVRVSSLRCSLLS